MTPGVGRGRISGRGSDTGRHGRRRLRRRRPIRVSGCLNPSLLRQGFKTFENLAQTAVGSRPHCTIFAPPRRGTRPVGARRRRRSPSRESNPPFLPPPKIPQNRGKTTQSPVSPVKPLKTLRKQQFLTSHAKSVTRINKVDKRKRSAAPSAPRYLIVERGNPCRSGRVRMGPWKSNIDFRTPPPCEHGKALKRGANGHFLKKKRRRGDGRTGPGRAGRDRGRMRGGGKTRKGFKTWSKPALREKKA